MTRRLVNPESKRERERGKEGGRVLGHEVREIPAKRNARVHCTLSQFRGNPSLVT